MQMNIFVEFALVVNIQFASGFFDEIKRRESPRIAHSLALA